jgi:hypothetical protein
VDWLVEANISEKHAVSIFRGVRASALKMETACFSETLASTNQSMWRLNPQKKNIIIRIITAMKILNLIRCLFVCLFDVNEDGITFMV